MFMQLIGLVLSLLSSLLAMGVQLLDLILLIISDVATLLRSLTERIANLLGRKKPPSA